MSLHGRPFKFPPRILFYPFVPSKPRCLIFANFPRRFEHRRIRQFRRTFAIHALLYLFVSLFLRPIEEPISQLFPHFILPSAHASAFICTNHACTRQQHIICTRFDVSCDLCASRSELLLFKNDCYYPKIRLDDDLNTIITVNTFCVTSWAKKKKKLLKFYWSKIRIKRANREPYSKGFYENDNCIRLCRSLESLLLKSGSVDASKKVQICLDTNER